MAPIAPLPTPESLEPPLPPKPNLTGPWALALARPLGESPRMSQVPQEQRFRAGSFFITVATAQTTDGPRWVLAIQHKGNMTAHKGRTRHRTKRTPQARERVAAKMQRVAVRMLLRVGEGTIIGEGKVGDGHSNIVLCRDLSAAEAAWMGKE